MKKVKKCFLVFQILCFYCMSHVYAKEEPLKNRIVVIDPGHGGTQLRK